MASAAEVDGHKPVAEIMAEDVVTAAPDTTVGEAWELLRQGPFRHLPVVENGLLVGIVSERDLKGAASDEARLRDIMTRMVYVLSPDTTVREAARRFRRWRVGAMPVLEGRRLVGMVSVLDVPRVPAEPPEVQG